MEYVLLMHREDAGWAALPPAAQAEMPGACSVYARAMVGAGAACIRQSEAGPVVLDGLYAATKEQLGGFDIIDLPDHAAALDRAAPCPGARHGTVELRAVLAPPPA